jgi:DNA (cytosine-5)-methyltransferase 1
LPTFGSLFAGIGGFDLGFERAGFKCAWQVEIDPWCRRVLAKHWPEVRRHDDVKTFPPAGDWSVDCIIGGFPCQDVSNAGRRVGIAGRRSGLWSEFHRIICLVRPRFVVVENTPGLLSRGMDRVLGDLAASGFDAEWSVLPACALGASHARARVFLVAHAAGERPGQLRWGSCQEEGAEDRDIPWPKTEPGLHRELDGVPDRVDRLTAIGNAVVPQVAEWIGRRLMTCMNSGEQHNT